MCCDLLSTSTRRVGKCIVTLQGTYTAHRRLLPAPERCFVCRSSAHLPAHPTARELIVFQLDHLHGSSWIAPSLAIPHSAAGRCHAPASSGAPPSCRSLALGPPHVRSRFTECAPRRAARVSALAASEPAAAAVYCIRHCSLCWRKQCAAANADGRRRAPAGAADTRQPGAAGALRSRWRLAGLHLPQIRVATRRSAPPAERNAYGTSPCMQLGSWTTSYLAAIGCRL